MTVLAILRWPDGRLAMPCAPATPGPAAARLATDMLDTMYAAPGRGLAAPQVGILERLFVMDVGWRDGARAPCACLNPEVLWRADTMATGPESCLSIPGLALDIPRATAICLRWTSPEGETREDVLSGFAAICAQHEMDHLDGRLTFDHLDPDARAAALAAYTGGGT